MPQYEYKVIPAPARAEKARGVKTPEGRFARTIEGELNRMGEAGWEYIRAELLPHEERRRLKAAQTRWRTVLVFRRVLEVAKDPLQARVVEAPLHSPRPEPVSDPAPKPVSTSEPAPVPVVVPVASASPPDRADPPLTSEPNVVSLPLRVDEDEPPR